MMAKIPAVIDVSSANVKAGSRLKDIADADYTVLDDDGFDTIVSSTTMTAARTVTLPTAADNVGRKITVKKADAGAFTLTVDGEGAETIDGAATFALASQYDTLIIQSNGVGWQRIGMGASLATDSQSGAVTAYQTSSTTSTVEAIGTAHLLPSPSGEVRVDLVRIGHTVTIHVGRNQSGAYFDSIAGLTPVSWSGGAITTDPVIPSSFLPASSSFQPIISIPVRSSNTNWDTGYMQVLNDGRIRWYSSPDSGGFADAHTVVISPTGLSWNLEVV